MASLCRRQQCTIERRGFRQELDSWRHKLLHCVGFESILEGLFGPALIEDLKLFKDCEPEAVSDWSFDENCLFCCLRRDKVKEHLVGLSNQGLEDTPKPLLVKDQTKINRLEKQAEEFLHAVLCRKDVPSFLDPHIPVVAREIMQRMIRQFAAEYTSKTSSPQDSLSDPQPSSDQSLPRPPSCSVASPSTSPGTALTTPAHNQNPVLSKLLMADQDAPLDLTIKKPVAEPDEQEGVLDLSLKKNRNLPVHSPYVSPTTSTLKGDSPKLHTEKAKDLQSTSTLEQFMAKLCPHHQRQIVDALGFLQTEVKALASTGTPQESNPTHGIQGAMCSTATSSLGTTKKSCSDPRPTTASTLKDSFETELSHAIPSSCAAKKVAETAVSLKTSLNSGPPLDLRTPGSGNAKALTPPLSNTSDMENRQSDHAPLKMKIMKSNLADGKKLSCVLATSQPHSGTLEERLGNPDSSNTTEEHSARLSPSLKKQSPNHLHQARQRDSLGHTKDTPAKPGSILKTLSSIPPHTSRTARKTIRRSVDQRTRDSACRVIADPDLGHCDIVYVDKPITDCLREQRRCMLPRRNARKSTRGHMYIEEMWELKTVRTLTGRNERGNCPNPMPEPITLVTPKQMLAKPDGVPPVDMPFAGGCGETISKQMPSEESDEREIPGTEDVVETAVREQDLIIETSQTDQSQTKEPSTPLTPLNSASENREMDAKADVLEDTATNSRQTKKGDLLEVSVTQTPPEAESVAQTPVEAESVAETPLKAESVAETPLEAEHVAESPLEAESVGGAPLEAESVAKMLFEAESVSELPLEAESVAEMPLEAESVAEMPLEAESVAEMPLEAQSVAEMPLEAQSVAEMPLEAESVAEMPLEAESVAQSPVEADSVTQTPPDVESVAQTPLEAEKESYEANGSTEELVSETCVQPLVNGSFDEVETHFVQVKDQRCQSEQQQKVETFPPSSLDSVDEVAEEVKGGNTEDKHIVEPHLAQEPSEENLCITTQAKGDIVKEQDNDAVKPINYAVVPTETEKDKNDDDDDDDEDYDLSSKTLDALLKELPPWRRKRGTVISLPKRLREKKSVIVGYVNGRPISASDRSLRRRSVGSSSTPRTKRTPAKSSQKVPKNSSIQSSPSQIHIPEMSSLTTSTENTPLVPQVTEPSPETPQISTSKHPIRSPVKIVKNKLKKRAEQIQQQITVESIQDTCPAPPPDQPVHNLQETGFKRPLRSAKLKPTETAVAPPPANATDSSSSPTSVAPSSLTSAEDLPSVPVSFPPPPVSPTPLVVSTPKSSEKSQQCTVQESTVEVNVAEVRLANANHNEIQNIEMESRLQTKQKLRSAKITTEINKNEKQPLCNDVSSPLESERVKKIKMQMSTPLKSRRNIRREGLACELTLQNSEISTLDDKAAGGDPNNSTILDKPAKRPLRNESSVSEMPHIQPPPVENMKSALRSQRLTTPSTSAVSIDVKQRKVVSPVRMKPERLTKTPMRSSLLSVNSVISPPISVTPFIIPRPEPLKQTNKFFEALNGEHNQQLLTNLNIKFDKMQKGWVQMDREGQTATKYRNKSDRQAAIWKSKRRTRKPKSVEHQRYSPVQMLFMKNFDITSICRWFLESTETKSLVIVKKVNTRLPSETQLCFHSSSGVSAASQGVFPSLQAERLKKHLKKFAIASPVKSNPKSQKLIAKALEQEPQTVKGKEKKELPTPTQALPKPHCTFADGHVQAAESLKASSKPKNPASARILRKYSNIREKMQVQHTNVRFKETPKTLKTTGLKTLSRPVSKSNINSALKGQKSLRSVIKQVKVSDTKMERAKTSPSRKPDKKPTVQESITNSPSSNRTSRDLVRKDAISPQRCSQRLGTLKALKDNIVHASTSSVDLNKKQLGLENTEAEKPALTRESGANFQSKEPSQSRVTEAKAAENSIEALQQSMDVKAGTSSDQVLTRSQRKMEATIPLGGSPNSSSRKTSKSSAYSGSLKSVANKTQEPTLTRSGTPKSMARKGSVPPPSQSVTPKLATKRAQEPSESPAKRTRMSHSK